VPRHSAVLVWLSGHLAFMLKGWRFNPEPFDRGVYQLKV